MAQAPTNQQRYAQSELLRRSCGRPCAAEVVLRFETLAADFGALLGRYGYPPVELPRFEVAEQPGATPAPSAELTRAVLALVEQLDAAIFDEFGYARRSGGGAAAARAARAGQRTTLIALRQCAKKSALNSVVFCSISNDGRRSNHVQDTSGRVLTLN